MNAFTFQIPGKPITWKRAIPLKQPGRRLDPNKELKNAIRTRALVAARLSKYERVDTGPVEVTIVCHFKRPKRGHAGETWYCARGRDDADNLAKLVLDSLNGVAFDDDGQVAKLSVSKVYTDGEARTVVCVIDPWGFMPPSRWV